MSAIGSEAASSPDATLAAYRTLSASQSRNYDKRQDISPQQMVMLLEVSERTGASLGQALATGEQESARTWNDHVRPTLPTGNLGSATGVWQFQPATFYSIVKKLGARLLAASEADSTTGRERLDLGEGPFTDAKVRSLIRETVGGKRGADDEDLQLLRHNFGVLAFAKHYLSLDSGATSPEEDYLFHFLGERQGRRVLALAQGATRDTLCVKPVEAPFPSLEPQAEPQAGDGRIASLRPKSVLQTAPVLPAQPTFASPIANYRPLTGSLRRGLDTRPTRPPDIGAISIVRARADLQGLPAIAAEPALFSTLTPDAPAQASSDWGLPADSPTVTGNLGMFYRDGKGQTQPYTWAEFVDNLARRVRADSQPALVRAKYGVGFRLQGGDLPERAFDPNQGAESAEFRHEQGRTVLAPEALVTGPLSRDEAGYYKQRLAALVSQGDDQPTETLPPESLSALQHLKLLPPTVQAVSTTDPQVQKALHRFREKVGKDEPDDPGHFNRLMPAERIALEIYDQRLARFAALQACQQASFGDAPDLRRIAKMPAGLKRAAAPHIAMLQKALVAQGLLTQPIKKSVWRDKKRKRHVAYKAVPFAGKADKATIAALNAFQLRNGLRTTEGVMDAVTLEMLGLPPMGPEIFLPLSGPQCAIADRVGTAPRCEIPVKYRGSDDIAGLAHRARPPAPLSLDTL